MNICSYIMSKLYALILINAIPQLKTLDILHLNIRAYSDCTSRKCYFKLLPFHKIVNLITLISLNFANISIVTLLCTVL